MSEKLKENKFIVINRKHLYALPFEERAVFINELSRLSSKLPDNDYIIINEDEPYAKKVWDLVLDRNTRPDSEEVERLRAKLSEAVELIRHIQRENIQNYEFYEMDDIKAFLSKQENP